MLPHLSQCGTWSQPLGREMPHTPPQQAPSSEGTPHHLHAELGDLNDSELWQLIKDLMQEIVQVWIDHAPSYPPLNDWVHPLGSREPEEDDQEVTFPGGGRWGPERQTSPVPESPAGGRVPSGPPQQSPCPALAGPDMGWYSTWQNRGVLRAMEPWGCSLLRTLSGVGGQRKHNEVSEGGSSRYGWLYGPYCWCLWNFGETQLSLAQSHPLTYWYKISTKFCRG